jgi:hypothetical protein
VALAFGKKTGAKYKANAEYTYQSYHSTRLPMEPEMMERSGEIAIAAKVAGKAGAFLLDLGPLYTAWQRSVKANVPSRLQVLLNSKSPSSLLAQVVFHQ